MKMANQIGIGAGPKVKPTVRPGPQVKRTVITTVEPFVELEAKLEADPELEDLDQELGDDDSPGLLEDDDDRFHENVEYEGDTDEDGDPSESAVSPELDWYGSEDSKWEGPPHHDLEIQVERNENNEWEAEVIVGAMSRWGRFAGRRTNQAVRQMETQILQLEGIGQYFVKTVDTHWSELLHADTLQAAGKYFVNFRQEQVAEKCGMRKETLSKFRDAIWVRLPKFGVVSLGDLFDAARWGELERYAEQVRVYLHQHSGNPIKKDAGKSIVAGMGMTGRRGLQIIQELEEEGLIVWPKSNQSQSDGRKVSSSPTRREASRLSKRQTRPISSS